MHTPLSSVDVAQLQHDIKASGRATAEGPLVLERVSIPTRNDVSRLISPFSAYLKVYRPNAMPGVARHEAAALKAVGMQAPTPDVICTGMLPQAGRAYLLTACAEGVALDQVFRDSAAERVGVLSSVLRYLALVWSNVRLPDPEARLISSHAPDFCPVAAVNRLDVEAARTVAGISMATRGPVLGSLSCNNILTLRRGGEESVAAFLDLEAARIGPMGFDQATLWYDLMISDCEEAADYLIHEIAASGEERLLQGLIASAAWICVARTQNDHPERALDLAKRDAVLVRLGAARTSAGL